eukprot:CAMPEP_0204184984 /NCGR_PEP_ID=MMETSP0361-20130328/54908_1 /ASSEMBLY_ACC=CAM_ASM_000343 /TAXON_ID=268821 /ORGANISM="Scrippsiella Hangoei, Strain SHTV-5" /LENGTH=86 /DNA_ID=CAMNT_0051145105 /DNA_START=74 /DNA_END=334 /DNA_ORIENTATION=+
MKNAELEDDEALVQALTVRGSTGDDGQVASRQRSESENNHGGHEVRSTLGTLEARDAEAWVAGEARQTGRAVQAGGALGTAVASEA